MHAIPLYLSMDGPIQKHKFSTRIYTNIKHDENIKNFGLNGSVRRRRMFLISILFKVRGRIQLYNVM